MDTCYCDITVVSVCCRVAVLNFPSARGLPDSVPSPQKDCSHETHRRPQSQFKHIIWNTTAGHWVLHNNFIDRLKKQGLRVPSLYMNESDAILAKQKCVPTPPPATPPSHVTYSSVIYLWCMLTIVSVRRHLASRRLCTTFYSIKLLYGTLCCLAQSISLSLFCSQRQP